MRDGMTGWGAPLGRKLTKDTLPARLGLSFSLTGSTLVLTGLILVAGQLLHDGFIELLAFLISPGVLIASLGLGMVLFAFVLLTLS